MEKTNITDSGKFRESLSDLTNTSNPFVLFFKIWGLFGVLADEIAGVVDEIRKLLDNPEKSHIYSLVYDVLPEKAKDITQYVQKIGNSGDIGRVMTFSEWKKRDIRIRRGVLSEYPDILDENKTDELTKFRLVRDYFARTQPQLTSLEIFSKIPWKVDFDLSILKKNEIRSDFQIEKTEKELLKVPVGAKNDPRFSFKLRIESTDDPEIRKEVIQEYIEWKISQIVANELKKLSEDVIFKVRWIETKGGITNRSSVEAIIALTDSILSPAFLPFVTNRLAKKLNGRLTVAQVRQYAYLISNIRAYSYDEYLSINKFFHQLVVAMDRNNHLLANASRYGFWFWVIVIAAIVFPAAVTLSLLALAIGFIVSDLEIVKRRLMHVNLGLMGVFAFLLIAFSVFWTLVTKGDFFTIKYHEYRYVINQLVLKNFPEIVSDWEMNSSPLKTSALEGRQTKSGSVLNESAPIDSEFLESCYQLNYVVENKSCFDGYETYLKSKTPAISTTGFSTGQLACVRAVSESFEPLGIGGTIWGKAEKMFNRYESECFSNDLALISKRDVLIDRTVRQYAHENVSTLATNSKSLGFRPENFGYDPMELARRLPSNTPIDPSRLSTLIVYEIGRLQSQKPVQ